MTAMLNAVGAAGDPRINARSNVFLTANLVAAGHSRPVRVRNISENGALLDGPDLPAEGSIVQLRRGGLDAAGEVAWTQRGQCGLKFDRPVAVKEWVKRVGHSGQAQVDEMIALVRRSRLAPVETAIADESGGDTLEAISADLAEVCERLASLPDLVAGCPQELSCLDVLACRLQRLADTAGS